VNRKCSCYILDHIRFLSKKLSSSDPLVVSESILELRKILSLDKNPPIAEVLEAGILPRLRELLSDFSRPMVQLEACWCLTNIASGLPEHTAAVVESGSVPLFVQLLSSSDGTLQEQAMWAIANIAGDRSEYRDGCISAGTVGALSSILDISIRTKCTQKARLGAWGLSNLCRGRPSPDFNQLTHSLGVLGKALTLSNDSEVLADTAWALSYLTDAGESDRITQILKRVDMNRLVALLGHPSSSVHTPILRVIGNLVSGQSEITRSVVTAGALNHLKSLAFSAQKKLVRKEALWAISNISADSQSMLQAVIDSGLMGLICDTIKEGVVDSEIRKEASWTICNAATVGSRNQIYTLVLKERYRILDLLCDYLESCRDLKTIKTVLDSIHSILRMGAEDEYNSFSQIMEECGGLAIIEDLQANDCQEVYESAVGILESFFDCEQIVKPLQDGMPILPFTRCG
jgi:importin subunit alpha-1